MSSILDLLITGLCSVTGGWYAREAWATWYHNKRGIDNDTPLNQLEIRAEQHGDTHFLYDATTNRFITQVRDYTEFLEYFEQHHPDTQIKMPREQYAALHK